MTDVVNLSAEKQSTHRQLTLDFLFLDLTTCTRCVGTGKNLETALEAVAQVLKLAGVEVRVNKILIESAEQAKAYRFVTSPTIRINGRDIALETIESRCDSCTDLCGCSEGTNCRVWLYQGQEYTEAPVPMVVGAILQEVFRSSTQSPGGPASYNDVPDNLQRFFAGKAQQTVTAPASCCSAAEQESCCEPSAKAGCCSEVATTGSCGCQ